MVGRPDQLRYHCGKHADFFPIDMLTEFSAVKVDSKQPAEASAPPAAAPPPAIPANAATSTSQPKGADDQPFSEADFAQQLQAGMAELLGELDKSVSSTPGQCNCSVMLTTFHIQPDMQAQFEEIFKQMHAATGEGAPAPAPAPATAAGNSAPKAATDASADGAADASFQETIRRTMERMQNSGDQATAAAASGGGNDFMAEMLKQLSSGDFGGEGGDEDFSKMLMGMMEQLTNKDILYEPMKELNTKFTDWMEKNKATTSAEDLKRYEEQQTIVAEIVARFETPTYSDSNAADREYIVDRMQKVSPVLRISLASPHPCTSRGLHHFGRCKQRDRHRPTSWATWTPRRKRLICRMTSAIHSRKSSVFGGINVAIHIREQDHCTKYFVQLCSDQYRPSNMKFAHVSH
jgi:peroxin-19